MQKVIPNECSCQLYIVWKLYIIYFRINFLFSVLQIILNKSCTSIHVCFSEFDLLLMTFIQHFLYISNLSLFLFFLLVVHASAWSIIYYGYIARKHGLTGVCLDSLSRIHTIPSVPIVDCFQKIRQQVKCYLQMAGKFFFDISNFLINNDLLLDLYSNF